MEDLVKMLANFKAVNSLDLKSKIAIKKSGKTELKYLSWSDAWCEFVKVYPNATYEIKKARIGTNSELELDLIWKSSLLNLGKIGEGTTAYFSCDSDKLGMTATNYSDVVFAPSLIKDLKQTFCTVGAGGRSVAKVDYPTP
jgi:hypothetical protein